MATLYYKDTVNTSWDTLGNWFTDSAHTIAASSIPAAGDVAYVDGSMYVGPSVLLALSAIHFGYYSTVMVVGGLAFQATTMTLGQSGDGLNHYCEFGNLNYSTFNVYGNTLIAVMSSQSSATSAVLNAYDTSTISNSGYGKNVNLHDSAAASSLGAVSVSFFDNSKSSGSCFGENVSFSNSSYNLNAVSASTHVTFNDSATNGLPTVSDLTSCSCYAFLGVIANNPKFQQWIGNNSAVIDYGSTPNPAWSAKVTTFITFPNCNAINGVAPSNGAVPGNVPTIKDSTGQTITTLDYTNDSSVSAIFSSCGAKTILGSHQNTQDGTFLNNIYSNVALILGLNYGGHYIGEIYSGFNYGYGNFPSYLSITSNNVDSLTNLAYNLGNSAAGSSFLQGNYAYKQNTFGGIY